MDCTNIKYYLVDSNGKHIHKNYESMLSAINDRFKKHISILTETKRPLNVKLRCVENLNEKSLEVYAFAFADERGAI